MSDEPSVQPTDALPENEADWKAKIEEARKNSPNPTPPPDAVEESEEESVDKEDIKILQEIGEAFDSPAIDKDLPANNISDFISFLVGDPENLRNLIDLHTNDKSPEQILAETKDPKSVMTKYLRLGFVLDSILRSNATRHGIKGLEAHLQNLEKPQGNTKDKLARGLKASKGELKGRDAKLNVLARLGGLRQVPLLNSGFWVTIRPFSISELHSFYQSVDIEREELGRLMGGLYFSFVDLYLKKKFMEIFTTAVESSNLRGWEDPEVLLNNISIDDYEILVWAVCSLIYRDGVTTTLYCPKPDCNYNEPNFDINIGDLRLNDYSIVPRADVEEMFSRKMVTPEDLQKWRDRPEFKERHTYVQEQNEMEYTFKIPTIAEYLDSSEQLMNGIIGMIGEKPSIRNEHCVNELVINIYRMFICWIEKVTCNTDLTNVWWTSDRSAILLMLEASKHENTTFNKDIVNFIIRTRISHVAYFSIQCPKCKATLDHNANIKDLVPVDVHSLFFALACRLISTSSRQQE